MNLELGTLKEQVKKLVLESGAKVFRVRSKERLTDALKSGNMDFYLPGAQSCIIWPILTPLKD